MASLCKQADIAYKSLLFQTDFSLAFGLILCYHSRIQEPFIPINSLKEDFEKRKIPMPYSCKSAADEMPQPWYFRKVGQKTLPLQKRAE